LCSSWSFAVRTITGIRDFISWRSRPSMVMPSMRGIIQSRTMAS